MESNRAPEGRDDSRPSAAAEARRQRRRARSRKKKRSARATTVLENLGWVALAAAVGIPLLAGMLYVAHL